jgi:N utilization substance protein A
VKTLDDLADLASDELTELLGTDAMDEATANEVIMAARAHWFADGDAPGDAPVDAGVDPDGHGAAAAGVVGQQQEAGHD